MNELQPLAGVHGHQLHGVLPGLRLVVARFQRGVGEKGGQRRLACRRFAGRRGLRIHFRWQSRFHACIHLRRGRGQRHGVAAKAFLLGEGLGGVHDGVDAARFGLGDERGEVVYGAEGV